MSEDWSYYHGRPRSEVHAEKFGSATVPSRKYRFGGGRYAASKAVRAADGGTLGLLALLGLLFLLTRKR